MATFKACVFKHHLKKDGTFNVKLRVIHQRETRLMSSPYHIEAKYVTSTLEIKDPDIQGLCEDLCYDCRRICRALGFTIDRMNVDERRGRRFVLCGAIARKHLSADPGVWRIILEGDKTTLIITTGHNYVTGCYNSIKTPCFVLKTGEANYG